ncbi:MAG: hypothetical protein WAN46_00580 [Gammaproteobacteria bacterium]|jgi:hypothetical protein
MSCQVLLSSINFGYITKKFKHFFMYPSKWLDTLSSTDTPSGILAPRKSFNSAIMSPQQTGHARIANGEATGEFKDNRLRALAQTTQEAAQKEIVTADDLAQAYSKLPPKVLSDGAY